MPILQTLRTKLLQLDRNPATPTLTYNGLPAKTNLLGGIIGLAFIALTLALIVIKSIGVFNREKLGLTSFVQRDMRELEMGPYDVAFYLSKRTGTGAYVDIPYQFYSLFGVDVFLVEIYYNFNTHQRHVKFYPLTPCSDEDDSVVCAKDIQYKPVCSLDQIDEQICPIIREYDILVFPCDSDSDPFCSPVLATGLLPVVFLRDNKFNVLNLNTKQIFQQTQVNVNSAPWLLNLDPNDRILYNVPVTKLIIQSDESILPRTIDSFAQINRTQTFFFAKQQITPVDRIRFSNAYCDFNIRRSPFTEVYNRSFARLDEMLGEIFGLIGLLSLVVGLLCGGYNRWAIGDYVGRRMREVRRGKGDEENADGGQEVQERKEEGNKLCRYVKQSFFCGKKQQQTDIDILEMYAALQKVKDLLGRQNFPQAESPTSQQNPQPTILTQPQPQQLLTENQQEIKRSLMSSQAISSSENVQRQRDSMKQ